MVIAAEKELVSYFSPRQTLLPLENAQSHWSSFVSLAPSVNHLSGINSSGSSNIKLLRCTKVWEIATVVYFVDQRCINNRKILAYFWGNSDTGNDKRFLGNPRKRRLDMRNEAKHLFDKRGLLKHIIVSWYSSRSHITTHEIG